MKRVYRNDIDGLRAIAVVAVVLFHLGYLTNGYLGVDVFFVISGYLITGIVYSESAAGKFSALKFYERRLRRIIPLTLFITTLAFVIGLLVMLPDDLENLCQSVFASNFSANNILMYITSSDYWDVRNEYKPLMHTWSLGVEEQFYLLYPVLFLVLKGKRLKYILPLLIGLATFSIVAFLVQDNVAAKFYFIQYRFFELAIGGICVIGLKDSILPSLDKKGITLALTIVALLFVLIFPTAWSNPLKVILTTVLSAVVLVLGQVHFDVPGWYKTLLSNKVMIGIGRISFSLYMWHQLIFAFTRYFVLEEISPQQAILLSSLTTVLSILTYYLVENPFRNRKKMATRTVILITGIWFALISSASFYVYAIGGILKDVPELGIYVDEGSSELNLFGTSSNIHNRYNADAREFDRQFSGSERPKILIVGNSFGRDFVNILMEAGYETKIDLSYFDVNLIDQDSSIRKRTEEADVIFYAAQDFIGKEEIEQLNDTYRIQLDTGRIHIVGTKDFGYSNGVHYRRIQSDVDCDKYMTRTKQGVAEANRSLAKEWGSRYINMIDLIQVEDEPLRVRVFTPDCKFFSHDTAHLTPYGAAYFAKRLQRKLQEIIKT